jgi:putative glutamine amidotransferase
VAESESFKQSVGRPAGFDRSAAPRIGITTYAVNSAGEIPLPEAYVGSIRRSGGIPLLIAPGETRLAALLDMLDGLVLAGGGDICPSRYGGRPHETIYSVNDQRDEFELQLVAELLERRLPTLAICRGLQVVNVALGGTLHPHLPDVVGQTVAHRAPPRLPIRHTIRLAADSRLAGIMQADGGVPVECMSWHHQAVDRPGQGCRAVATAPDGVVEAIEIADRPELIAVQWHPELTSHEAPIQQRLFDELVRLACRAS